VELGAFGLLDRPVRVTKRLEQAVPKRPVLYELRMNLEAARLSSGKSDRRTRVREAQREGVRGEGGAGGNNLESSFLTLTVKVASTERQTKFSWWTQNVRATGGTASYIGQALRSTASRCQKCRNGGVPFLDCNLRFGDNRYMEGGGEERGARFRAA